MQKNVMDLYKLFIVLQNICIAVVLLEITIILIQRPSKIQQDLLFLLLSLLCVITSHSMEIRATDMGTVFAIKKFSYVGKPFMYLFMLFLLMDYCRIERPHWLSVSLFLFQASETVVVLTAEKHMLFYSSIEGIVYEGLFPHLELGRSGPLYIFYNSANIIFAFVMTAICIRSFILSRSSTERKQLALFISLILITPVFFLLFITKLIPTTYDSSLIILGYFLGSLGLFYSFFKFKLLDTITLAKEQAADYSDSGIVICNTKGKKLFSNAAADKLDIKDRLEDLAEEKDSFPCNGRVYSAEKTKIERNGILYGFLYLIRDTTDISRYEQKLKEEKQKADEANAAKSEFLACMSHELRTPMNAVLGMAEVLMRGNWPKEESHYLSTIHSAATSILSIINDLLDYSKIEAGKFQITEGDYKPQLLIDELVPIFTQRIGNKPLKMLYDIDSELPSDLRGDDIRIRQVIINLVNNAIKYSDSGNIILSLKVIEKNPEMVKIRFSVTDNGIGIKKEELSRLFQAFTRFDMEKNRNKEGSGLGLAISSQLVSLMGGQLCVNSEYGKGSEFYFTLTQKSLSKTLIGQEEVSVNKKKLGDDFSSDALSNIKKILLVDDVEMNREVVQALLSSFGITIDEAENGLEAVDMAMKGGYDVILMDNLMPVMGGIESCRKIREQGNRVPIIALSASQSQADIHAFLQAGMDEVASKPVILKDLISKITKVCSKGSV